MKCSFQMQPPQLSEAHHSIRVHSNSCNRKMLDGQFWCGTDSDNHTNHLSMFSFASAPPKSGTSNAKLSETLYNESTLATTTCTIRIKEGTGGVGGVRSEKDWGDLTDSMKSRDDDHFKDQQNVLSVHYQLQTGLGMN